MGKGRSPSRPPLPRRRGNVAASAVASATDAGAALALTPLIADPTVKALCDTLGWDPRAAVRVAELAPILAEDPKRFSYLLEQIRQWSCGPNPRWEFDRVQTIPSMTIRWPSHPWDTPARGDAHRALAQQHGDLMQSCLGTISSAPRTGSEAWSVPVTDHDATRDPMRFSELVASISLVMQAQRLSNGTLAPLQCGGLFMEILAEALLVALGWEVVPGVGGYYANGVRRPTEEYARTGQGIDLLVRRRSGTKKAGTWTYMVVEVKSRFSIEKGALKDTREMFQSGLGGRLFSDSRPRSRRPNLPDAASADAASGEGPEVRNGVSASPSARKHPQLSDRWVRSHLEAQLAAVGRYAPDDHDRIREFLGSGESIRKMLIVVTDWNNPGHIPPDDLYVLETLSDGSTRHVRIADECITLRIPSGVAFQLRDQLLHAREQDFMGLPAPLDPRAPAADQVGDLEREDDA